MPQNWLDGVWTGAGYQQEGYIWSIRLTANTEKNEFRIEYPSIGGSGGQWTLIEKDSTADRYTFEERIFPPDGITEDGGRIIVTKILIQSAFLLDKLKMYQQSSAGDAATKIQGAFRNHQARLVLKDRATWKIHEKLEYSSEQTEGKLRDMFEKLLNSSDILSPSVTKLLQKPGLPVEEKELLRLTNPDDIQVEANYRGPHIKGQITRSTFVDLIEAFQKKQVLHEKYVNAILHQARSILKTLPNVNRIDLSNLYHIFIVGDLHGQLSDLLYIFHTNGLPALDNPYIFNGDFVDRGPNSVEVILLLLVALILYPSSVFLNRGNHEDIVVTARYGFQEEINRKYPKCKTPLLDLFKDTFSWLPIYANLDTGKSHVMIVHGGISNRINLKQINSLTRNRYISLIIPPKSKNGGERLTKNEEDEYLQMADLLWSDPDPEGRPGCRKNDDRNTACFFGPDITKQFLSKNHFSMIIRSHQVKEKGYEFEHGNKVLTVFSASNYSDESNSSAIVRWDYESAEPCIISFTLQDVSPTEKLSFNKQVAPFEDPVYQSLMKKIVAKKSLLKNEFEKSDRNQTNHLSATVWSDIMKNVLQIDLPWLTLRSKFVKEDTQGILYKTMLEEYTLDNAKFQKSNTDIMEHLYIWKDVLLTLFNLIDLDHSGFISREEFSDVIKLLLYDEHGVGDVNQAYIEELTSAMDLDKNGKIDVNEFLESFRIVNVKKPENLHAKPKNPAVTQ
ncbi:unnamed protein product, partial [Rotaria socialis]